MKNIIYRLFSLYININQEIFISTFAKNASKVASSFKKKTISSQLFGIIFNRVVFKYHECSFNLFWWCLLMRLLFMFSCKYIGLINYIYCACLVFLDRFNSITISTVFVLYFSTDLTARSDDKYEFLRCMHEFIFKIEYKYRF